MLYLKGKGVKSKEKEMMITNYSFEFRGSFMAHTAKKSFT